MPASTRTNDQHDHTASYGIEGEQSLTNWALELTESVQYNLRTLLYPEIYTTRAT
jgi:hypothetical protein